MRLDLRYRQDKDYNCGPYALAFFLDLHGGDEDGRELEYDLRPTKSHGTDRKKIEKFLTSAGLKIKTTNRRSTWGDIAIPSLVLYKPEGCGHYGVAVAKTDDYIVIAEPWYAQTHKIPKEKFLKAWRGYSGVKWSLSLA